MTYDTFSYQRALRDDRTLSMPEYSAAMTLSIHAGTDGLNAHPGVKLLALEAKCSEKTVKRALARLLELGWITRTFNGRGGNHDLASVYKLHIPKGHSDPLKDSGQIPKGHSDPTNTLLSTNTDDDSKGHSDPLKVAEDLESSPALDLSSQVIGCPHPNCKKPAPSTDTELLAHLERYHPWLLKQHAPKRVASKPAPARPPGPGAPARKPVNKWECEQCGGTFSYLNTANKTMCKKCIADIEG